jgi:predicted PurR-regulated permease PerM
MVQRSIASIPVIVTLFAVIGFAGLLGAMGVLFAMPLTVIIYTLVRRLYTGEDVTQKKAEKPLKTALKPKTR